MAFARRVLPLSVAPESVGDVPNTAAPDPVSSVSAVARFADDGVPRKVATFAPKPETPVEIGSDVASVRLKAGVASVPPSASETPPNETVELVRPALLRVPVSDGVSVRAPFEALTVRPVVRPLNAVVDVENVTVVPVVELYPFPRAVR